MTEELKNNKKVLIILSGPPLSGKSTFGKKFAEDNKLNYVSTDEIRAEIGGSESNQNVSAQAFSLARQRVKDSLSKNKGVMIDATSVNRKARKDWIDIGKSENSFIISVCFEVPFQELVKRNANRERKVPEDIIKRFFDKYERPSELEGIDKIIVK